MIHPTQSSQPSSACPNPSVGAIIINVELGAQKYLGVGAVEVEEAGSRSCQNRELISSHVSG